MNRFAVEATHMDGSKARRSPANAAPRRPGGPAIMHSTSPTAAFVLSGGASLGTIQVGMLHALYERGIAPPCPLEVQPVDLSRADQLIEQALRDGRQFPSSIASTDPDTSPTGAPRPAAATPPRRERVTKDGHDPQVRLPLMNLGRRATETFEPERGTV
jgi:hypothetical protein